jgi:hypothetical protein
MTLLNQASVYWIHLLEHTDINTQGYVGVSKDVDFRTVTHLRQLVDGTHTNPHLKYAFDKYGWEKFKVDVVLCGDEAYCYVVENSLRPLKNIGWNITIGGHRGPGWTKGVKKSQQAIAKQKATTLLRYGNRKELREIARKAQVATNRAARAQQKAQAAIDLQQERDRIKQERAKKKLQKSERIQQERQQRRQERAVEKAEISLNQPRPICPYCSQRPRAVAYHRPDRIYYRSGCMQCLKRSQHRTVPKMRWQLAGYKKKPTCDLCGFRARYSAQLQVFHMDGNLNNTGLANLKTICQNCAVGIKKSDQPSRAGDLEPDL